MKDSPARAIQDALWPCSEMSMKDRYDVAWRTLLQDGNSLDIRCHAKCWLTYRAVDKAIQLKDWLEQIDVMQFHAPEPYRSRWGISQNVVEMYLWIVHGDFEKAHHHAAGVSPKFLKQCPTNAVNYIRAKAFEAMFEIMKGHKKKAMNTIYSATRTWNDVIRSIDFLEHPWHFMEMQHSWEPLSLMMHLAAEYGLVKHPEPEYHRKKEHVTEPWKTCLAILKSKLPQP